MLLLVELYEPHVASSGRKTTRGIALAAFIGLAAYSLVFIVQQNTNSATYWCGRLPAFRFSPDLTLAHDLHPPLQIDRSTAACFADRRGQGRTDPG